MKANELMIGDWVLVHEPTCKGHRVDYINEMEEEIGADGEIYDACDIKPIPITPEILEKNGFKKSDECEQWTLYKPSCYCILWSAYEPYLEISSYNEDSGEFNRMGIPFIHQLQNALRLCGIEKEITL